MTQPETTAVTERTPPPLDANATTQVIQEAAAGPLDQAELTRTTEAAQKFFDAASDHAEGGVEGSPGRARDEHGRFVGPKTEERPPEAPGAGASPESTPGALPSAGAKLSAPWVQAAHDVFFTDEEIDSFPNDSVLRAATLGRRMELSQQYSARKEPPGAPADGADITPAQQDPRTTGQTAPSAGALEAFDLKLNENELGEEVSGPLKAMAAHMTKMQETLMSQNEQLRQQMGQLQGVTRQGVEAAADAQTSRDAQEWDGIVTAHPEIAKAIGTPSEAHAKPGSAQHRHWKMLVPVIAEVYERYKAALGEERMDRAVWSRITKEAFEESGLARLAGSTGSTGSAGSAGSVRTNNVQHVPGTVVAGDTSRRSTPPSQGGKIEDEFDRSMQVMTEEWDRSGGNPFRE